MQQIPPLAHVVVLVALLLAPGTADKKTAVSGCWADGRTDVLVMTTECPPPLPPLEALPLWLSWYDPALCWENGRVIENINCDADPTTMAGGTAVSPEMYGYAAACVPVWFDQTVRVKGIGAWHCLDVGGAVIPTYREIFDPQAGFITQWVLPIDILHDSTQPDPWWQYLPIAAGAWEVTGE
ncbi:MAG: hypothetical protein KDK05_00435 [Candidatus Competibacteraceae bacterium]|nr:hypothetical protein [Candidatus Competibacteraceae bacterium]